LRRRPIDLQPAALPAAPGSVPPEGSAEEEVPPRTSSVG
jgi:hypothetical protein